MMFAILFGINLGSLVLATCSDSEFIGCVIRLKSQGAPFGRNMMKIVFDVETEAKLLHTCKVYSSVLPCFSEKIEVCGDTKQKRLMKEVDSIFMFLCSPFSLQRQSLFLEHRECISSTMNKAQKSSKCNLASIVNGEDVVKCKEACMVFGQADIVCMVNSWVSEQNVCTLHEIRKSCGDNAADFYKSIQQYVFDPKFPIVCEESIDTGSNKNQTKKETTKKNEKKLRLKNKNYKKVTESVVSTTDMSSNDSASQLYQMPMRKDHQDMNEIFDVSKYTAKPVEATYKIYNSLRAVLQANMSPQIVDMLKKTSDTFNIENKNLEFFAQENMNSSMISTVNQPLSFSTSAPTVKQLGLISAPVTAKQLATSTVASTMNQLLNLEQLTTSTAISYTSKIDMISNGDGSSNEYNTTSLTKTKLVTYYKPKLSMNKWRPWYLDGN